MESLEVEVVRERPLSRGSVVRDSERRRGRALLCSDLFSEWKNLKRNHQ